VYNCPQKHLEDILMIDTSRPVLALDLDDVIKDTATTLCWWHNHRYGTAHTPAQMTDFYLDALWQCSRKESEDKLWEFFHSEHHHTAAFVEGAEEGLHTLAAHYELHVVTARPSDVHRQTISWIDQNCPGLFAAVHLTGSPHKAAGTGRQKSVVCREIGACAFVDDAIHNVEDVHATGIRTLLFHSHANRLATPPVGVLRVHSWADVVRELTAA